MSICRVVEEEQLLGLGHQQQQLYSLPIPCLWYTEGSEKKRQQIFRVYQEVKGCERNLGLMTYRHVIVKKLRVEPLPVYETGLCAQLLSNPFLPIQLTLLRLPKGHAFRFRLAVSSSRTTFPLTAYQFQLRNQCRLHISHSASIITWPCSFH